MSDKDLMVISRYASVVDVVYNKPPGDVKKVIYDIIKRYPVEVFEIPDMAYLLLVKIRKGFYGISWVCVRPEDQGCGMGTQLLCQVLSKYSGLFVAKTHDAGEWYRKNGFVCVKLVDGVSVWVLVSDVGVVDF